MALVLRQSTAVDVLIGPFVDSANGYTAEAGVSPAVKLSKNGQTLTAKSDVTTPVHSADGYYNCELDATDTNTVGTLVLSVVGSATSLPVRHEYQVLDETAYDTLYATTATVLNAGDVGMIFKSTIATVNSQTSFVMTDGIASTNVFQYCSVTIYDASTQDYFQTWVVSVDHTTDTIVIAGTPTFTVVANDILRVYAHQHPRAAVNNAALLPLATFDTNADLVRAKLHLLARRDTGATTDYAAAMADINTDEGSGAGDYHNETDSLQAQRDLTKDSNIISVDGIVITGAGTPADPWGP